MTRTAIVLIAALAATSAAAQQTAIVISPLSPLPYAMKPTPLTRSPEAPRSPESPVPGRQVLPPLEFDKPYKGKLTVTRVDTQRAVMDVCPKTPFPLKLACAYMRSPQAPDGSWEWCHMILVADEVIRSAGYTPDTVYRHEIGHCNGWPKGHAGAQ
jgi:hypothetical protein